MNIVNDQNGGKVTGTAGSESGSAAEDKAANGKNVSLWSVFGVFSKIGAFTIGGGYVMLPLIGDEVTKRGWISEEDYKDVTVLAQSAPGILAINIAYYAGYRIKGVKGSIVAAIGAALPSFLIILAIAMVFTNFKDNVYVRKFFQGIRPVAVALILSAALNMVKGSRWTWWAAVLALGTIFLVAFLSVSPIWIILTVIAGAISISIIKDRRK
jgi:chromate transporter